MTLSFHLVYSMKDKLVNEGHSFKLVNTLPSITNISLRTVSWMNTFITMKV